MCGFTFFLSISICATSHLDLNVHINHPLLKVMQKENETLFWVTLMDGGRFESALTPVTCFYELILDADIKIDLVVVGVITAPLFFFFFFFLR